MENYITKEGLEQLKEELEYLETVRRKQVAKRIKKAIEQGDLSENAEYTEAKDEQAFVEGRILEYKEKVKNAKIITKKKGGKKRKGKHWFHNCGRWTTWEKRPNNRRFKRSKSTRRSYFKRITNWKSIPWKKDGRGSCSRNTWG